MTYKFKSEKAIEIAKKEKYKIKAKSPVPCKFEFGDLSFDVTFIGIPKKIKEAKKVVKSLVKK